MNSGIPAVAAEPKLVMLHGSFELGSVACTLSNESECYLARKSDGKVFFSSNGKEEEVPPCRTSHFFVERIPLKEVELVTAMARRLMEV